MTAAALSPAQQQAWRRVNLYLDTGSAKAKMPMASLLFVGIVERSTRVPLRSTYSTAGQFNPSGQANDGLPTYRASKHGDREGLFRGDCVEKLSFRRRSILGSLAHATFKKLAGGPANLAFTQRTRS